MDAKKREIDNNTTCYVIAVDYIILDSYLKQTKDLENYLSLQLSTDITVIIMLVKPVSTYIII